MRRRDDWPERLAYFLAEARGRPFAWGSWDCCLFVVEAIRAMTGIDLGERYRGTYSDEAGAVEILARDGGVVGIATAMLGAPLPTPLLAKRGDVVAVETRGGTALGVVAGKAAMLLTPECLAGVSVSAAIRGWSV